MPSPVQSYALLILCTLLLSACTGVPSQTESNPSVPPVDQSQPLPVLQAIIDVARTGQAARLQNLCDPLHQNDLDCQRICDQWTGFDPQSSYALYFRDAQIIGSPAILGDTANVPLRYGPAQIHLDTLRLIRRQDKWYLFSF